MSNYIGVICKLGMTVFIIGVITGMSSTAFKGKISTFLDNRGTEWVITGLALCMFGALMALWRL